MLCYGSTRDNALEVLTGARIFRIIDKKLIYWYKQGMAESIITKVVASFTDREHLRTEIPVRTILSEIQSIRDILRAGAEQRMNPETADVELAPIGETRIKELTLLWNIDKELLHLVIPNLKPIGVTVKVPELSKEDMEPHNIRPRMIEHVASGAITPESADMMCKVAGAIEGKVEEDDEPTAFEVNLNLVDARVQRDEHGIIIESDEEEDDVGDVFKPVG